MRWKDQQQVLKQWIHNHLDNTKVIHNDGLPMDAKAVTGYSMTEIKRARKLVKKKQKKERRNENNNRK